MVQQCRAIWIDLIKDKRRLEKLLNKNFPSERPTVTLLGDAAGVQLERRVTVSR